MFSLVFARRERDISEEVLRRRAAESRLDQLVEMYGDPAVTHELRERLPRASKRDYRTGLRAEIQQLRTAQQYVTFAGFEFRLLGTVAQPFA